MGGGFLTETAAFAQDEQSKEQFTLLTDAPTHSWRIRQTGVMIEVPKLWGYFFIGRAKEGFSLNKVMTGYDGWTMERSTMSDATIPLLADGIKWLGYSPKHGFLLEPRLL